MYIHTHINSNMYETFTYKYICIIAQPCVWEGVCAVCRACTLLHTQRACAPALPLLLQRRWLLWLWLLHATVSYVHMNTYAMYISKVLCVFCAL